MATLSYAKSSATGATVTFASASGSGDKIAPNPAGVVIVTNGSGASVTVTVATPGNDKYGLSRPDITVSVPASASKAIGPLPADLADPSDGLVAITYSSATSVTVAAVAAR